MQATISEICTGRECLEITCRVLYAIACGIQLTACHDGDFDAYILYLICAAMQAASNAIVNVNQPQQQLSAEEPKKAFWDISIFQFPPSSFFHPAILNLAWFQLSVRMLPVLFMGRPPAGRAQDLAFSGIDQGSCVVSGSDFIQPANGAGDAGERKGF